MSLKISEVSKLLDMPVETIRFYEKHGIVKPIRKDGGKIREYETWDIFFLTECMMYRNMGFSVKDVARILHKDDLPQFLEKIDKQIVSVNQEIQNLNLLKTYLETYKTKLDALPYNVGNYWFFVQPERKYMIYTHRERDYYSDINPNNPLYTAWIKKLPFVYGAQHISLDDLVKRDSINRDLWSLMIDEPYISLFDLPIDEAIETIPAQLCLSTIIDAGERGEFSLQLLEPILSFIKKTKYEIDGQIIGRLMLRTHEKNKMHRYIEVVVPVKTSTNCS